MPAQKSEQATQATQGAALQIRGIQTQMTAQASYALTGDPKFKAEFEQGVKLGDQGSAIVAKHGDAFVADIAKGAERVRQAARRDRQRRAVPRHRAA